MLTTQTIENIRSEARLIIERQMDDALMLAALRDAFAAQGGDWGALKALIKAEVQDEKDESGDRKKLRKVTERASATVEYADRLGLNMNEENYSGDDVTITDHEDEDGNRLVVRVDPRIAAILAKSAA